MRIGELATATGVDIETIRYYEREGLLAPPARQTNSYRIYGQAHPERLSFIRHCRALDIPLADIRRLLGFPDASGNDSGGICQLFKARLVRWVSLRARQATLAAVAWPLTLPLSVAKRMYVAYG
ncbi:MAG: MerR family transcriptional regulator [Burkholderiales bacterium]|nr:MerR family transcriptional regulator [Burkholderiales bacterium]